MVQLGQLLQTYLRQTASPASRTLELSPGQVVKGTVVKINPDQTALVQIGNVPLHARLETPMEAGQQAWLEVQGTDGQIRLKVLTATGTNQARSELTVESLLQSLGMPDQKETRTVVQAMVREGLPVTRETIEAFRQLVQQRGFSDSLLSAFLFAVKRNLPLTADVVSSVRAFFSDSVTQGFHKLQQEIEAFLAQAPSAEGEFAPEIRQARDLIHQLRSLLRQLPLSLEQLSSRSTEQLSSHSAEQSSSRSPGQLTSHSPGHLSSPLPDGAGSDGQMPGQSIVGRGTQLPHAALLSADSDQGLSASSLLGDTQGDGDAGTPLLQARADRLQQGLPKDVSMNQHNSRSGGQATTSVPAQLSDSSTLLFPTLRSVIGENGEQAGKSIPKAPQTLEGAIGWEGLTDPENERNNATSTDRRSTEVRGWPMMEKREAAPFGTAVQKVGTGSVPMLEQAAREEGRNRLEQATFSTVGKPVETGESAEGVSANRNDGLRHPLRQFFQQLGLLHEKELSLWKGSVGDREPQLATVKGLLLQLTQQASPHLSAGLREAAEHVLHTITGQQLMLSPSMQTSPLTQWIIQIPLRDGAEEQTAFVQIEARKQETGDLDPENCRLYFHLQLATLGLTTVDVSIVNRIVSIQLQSDFPGMEALVQSFKDEFSRKLSESGYYLSGMRIQPLSPAEQACDGGLREIRLADYKGVDFRI